MSRCKDKELLQEWEWSERYPEQPEILRYLERGSRSAPASAPAR
jgi:hypothetical protein